MRFFAPIFTIFFFVVLIHQSLHAETGQNIPPNALMHPDYPAFKNKMVKEFSVDPDAVDNMMASATYVPNVLRIMNKPGEHKEWFEYKAGLITPRNINNGVAFAQKYSSALNQAEKQYGVPKAIILGILGVETAFGHNMGSFRILDALYTLGFYDTRRRDLFTQELAEFLVLSRVTHMDPRTQVGSYAGAIGYPQFMPSSIRLYAVDFNSDGKIDLNQNPVDAIGSIAHFLADKGWQVNAPIGTPATFNGLDDSTIIAKDLTMPVTVKSLADKGLTPKNMLLKPSTLANGIRLQGDDGPLYWITFSNFQIITTYNRSRMYATAVWQLGNKIDEALVEQTRTAERAYN